MTTFVRLALVLVSLVAGIGLNANAGVALSFLKQSTSLTLSHRSTESMFGLCQHVSSLENEEESSVLDSIENTHSAFTAHLFPTGADDKIVECSAAVFGLQVVKIAPKHSPPNHFTVS